MITPDLFTRVSMPFVVAKITLISPTFLVSGLKPFVRMVVKHDFTDSGTAPEFPDNKLFMKKPEAATITMESPRAPKKNFRLEPRALTDEFI